MSILNVGDIMMGMKHSYIHFWCEYKMVQPFWSLAISLKKLSICLSYDPALTGVKVYVYMKNG